MKHSRGWVRHLLRSLALRIGPLRRLYEQRDALRDRVASLEAEAQELGNRVARNAKKIEFLQSGRKRRIEMSAAVRRQLNKARAARDRLNGELTVAQNARATLLQEYHAVARERDQLRRQPAPPAAPAKAEGAHIGGMAAASWLSYARDYVPNSPVIVCGLPRSGTTMIGKIISSHTRIWIGEEMPTGRLAALKEFFQQYEAYLSRPTSTFRGIQPGDLRKRVPLLMISMWQFVGNPGIFYGDPGFSMAGTLRFGMKTPNSEADFEFYNEVFREHLPKFVYCLRSPYSVLRSRIALDWGGDAFETCLKLYERSYSILRSMQALHPRNVKVVQIDKVGPLPEHRLAFARDLFAFVGEEMDAAAEAFVRDWPTVDNWPLLPKDQPIAADDPLGIVPRETLVKFGGHPVIAEILDKFGYERIS